MADLVQPAELPLAAPAAPTPAAAEPSVAAPAAEAAPIATVASEAPAAADVAPASDTGKSADPKLDPTLLEKFDAEQKAKDAAAAAEKAAKPADKAPEVKPADKAADKATDKAAEAKPADKAADAAPADKVAEPAKLEPVAYEYKLPDTLKMDDALKGQLHSALDSFRADPAKGAQGLIDLHNQSLTAFADATRKAQFDTFNETKAAWETQWKADEQIGGAGYQTALGAIARTRDIGISNAKPGTDQYKADCAAFDQFLAVTGAGSHPVFGKLLHNLARYIDEPQAGEAPTDIRPPKNNGKAPGSRLYDHPSSQRVTR